MRVRKPRGFSFVRFSTSIFLHPSTLLQVGAVLLLSACRNEMNLQYQAGAERIGVIGNVGRQPGQFVKPRAVALTLDNQLIVIDRSGRIQRFDATTGEYSGKWMIPDYSNGTPTGMTLDPKDNTLWIADTHYQRILHYDLDGRLLWQFGEHGTTPGKMVFPTDVCPDPQDGSLWVAEYGVRSRIMHFSGTGEFIKEWGSEEHEFSELQRPMALAFDQKGRLYVADAGNHRIVIFDREGAKLGEWGKAGTAPGMLKYPYDISFAPDGTLYICEYGTSRVSHFTAEGEFLGCWGGPGHDAGHLYSPWGLAVGENGRLAVADTNNGRIQIVDHPERLFRKENAG